MLDELRDIHLPLAPHPEWGWLLGGLCVLGVLCLFAWKVFQQPWIRDWHWRRRWLSALSKPQHISELSQLLRAAAIERYGSPVYGLWGETFSQFLEAKAPHVIFQDPLGERLLWVNYDSRLEGLVFDEMKQRVRRWLVQAN